MHIPQLVTHPARHEASYGAALAKSLEKFCPEEILLYEGRAEFCKSLGDFLSQFEEAGVQSERFWTCGPGWGTQLLFSATEPFEVFQKDLDRLHPAVLAWVKEHGHPAFLDRKTYERFREILRWYSCHIMVGMAFAVEACPSCGGERRVQASTRGEFHRLNSVCAGCGREIDRL